MGFLSHTAYRHTASRIRPWQLAWFLCLFSISAHAGIHAKWAVALSFQPTEYYSTAQAACQRQHDFYAPTNPGPITAEPVQGHPFIYKCDWKDHTDGPPGTYPIAPLPAQVALNCVNDNNQP